MDKIIEQRAPKGNPRSSGYARADADWYVEPPEAVDALFDAERFVGDVYDPACGTGTILHVASRRGHAVVGSDIRDRGGHIDCFFLRDFVTESDIGWTAFRSSKTISLTENIVTNPPYGESEGFVRCALATARRKVAMLLRLSFLEGQMRAKMFRSTPLARVHVFSWRISMPSGEALKRGAKPSGGSVAFAWFVWDHDHRGPPTINWLERPD